MLFPTASSGDLNVEILASLLHGGHSFVFKTRTTIGTGALKIFRFTLEDPRKAPIGTLNPYLYFNREVEAYTRLVEGGAVYCPRVLSIVSISAEDEKALKPHMQGYNAALHRQKLKKTEEELPLKALLIEWIHGDRLTSETLLSDISLQDELLDSVGHMHGCGVVWGDATWRNILISKQLETEAETDQIWSELGGHGKFAANRRLVLLDYSNARCRLPMIDKEDQQSQELDENPDIIDDWTTMIEQEYGLVKHMVASGKVRSHGGPRYPQPQAMSKSITPINTHTKTGSTSGLLSEKP